MFCECGYSKREICALFGGVALWSLFVSQFFFLKFCLGSCFFDAKHGVRNVFHIGSS